ncbi:MAG: hypothetical protein G01um10147_1107 [Microgenomates group bacterium Gr01-1014_7]|nr:MAG: hypothetical protein G01um10147_1107 [Microgenomates group bacterium Gr01-1014_7]
MNSHQISPIKSDLVNLFGDLRIKASWQLPVAYRSRVRPSSVLSSKASTVCINVEIYLAQKNFGLHFSVFTFQSASGVFPCGPERARTAYLLIANEMFYQLNYRPGLKIEGYNAKSLKIFRLREDPSEEGLRCSFVASHYL